MSLNLLNLQSFYQFHINSMAITFKIHCFLFVIAQFRFQKFIKHTVTYLNHFQISFTLHKYCFLALYPKCLLFIKHFKIVQIGFHSSNLTNFRNQFFKQLQSQVLVSYFIKFIIKFKLFFHFKYKFSFFHLD